jgi:hypothetical protein
MTVNCRTCGQAMTLTDEETQRWYCYKDDLLYYAKENRWGGPPKADIKRIKKSTGTKKQRGMFIVIPIGAILTAAYSYYRSHLVCLYYGGINSGICVDQTGEALGGAIRIASVGFLMVFVFYWLLWHFIFSR